MKKTTLFLLAAACAASGQALAQAASANATNAANALRVRNVLQLSATGQVQVPQDMLTLVLSTSRSGNDAAAVQAELRKAVEAALAEARKHAKDGRMDVSSGSFGISQRRGSAAKAGGWQGNAELLLTGRDFALILHTAAKTTSMTIQQMSFSLSREQRQRAEDQAQAQAIQRFKARAAELTKAFGFTSYNLREVTISDSGAEFIPYLARAEVLSASAGEAAPAQPGMTEVQVTVSGSVQAQ